MVRACATDVHDILHTGNLRIYADDITLQAQPYALR